MYVLATAGGYLDRQPLRSRTEPFRVGALSAGELVSTFAAPLFTNQCRSGSTPGGVLIARLRGEIVLAEAVGLASGLRGTPEAPAAQVPMTVNTRFQVMSSSKAVVAFAIALLEDRGLLDVNAPVARVWPEFAARGKADITVLDVLTHRSGLVLEELIAAAERWRDWHGVVDAISAAPLDYSRGTLAYEAYAFGWILGEIVRRTRRSPHRRFSCRGARARIRGATFPR